jgi:N-acetylmuramoyl-L-alanine amidase
MRPIGIAIAIVWHLGAAAAAAQQPSIEKLFLDAGAKEQAVRTALSSPDVGEAALKAVRTVVADYEAIVRRFPTSAYCDDALWRAGRLSLDAYSRFGAAEDQAAGIRLLRAVISEYPTSKFAKQAPAVVAAAGRRAPGNDVKRERTVQPPAPVAQSAPTVPVQTTGATRGGAPRIATIKDIRRVVLPDAVRIVIELDGEVPTFHDERLANPVRVFVDLPATQTTPELVDRTIRFDSDADVVRQVRLGRHPNTTTRVVVDAAGITSYSVYPLYSPYRLVIDFFRVAAPVTSAPATPAPVTPAPAVPALGRRVVAPAVGLLSPGSSPPPLPRDTPTPALQGRRIVGTTATVMPRGSAPPALTPALAPPREIPLLPLPSTAIKTRPIVIDAPMPASLSAALAAAGVTKAAATTASTTTATAAAAPAPPRPAPLPAKPVAAAAGTTTTTTATPIAPAAPVLPPPPNLAGGLSMARQLGLGVSRIVIDPGHGGHDPGGVVRGTTEAAIVLDVALRLEKLLAAIPGVEVILTRRTDEFLPLQERTAIANREGADLFLSIHANANNNTRAGGVETYFLNFATNSSAAAIAARENATSGQAMGALPDFVKMIALNNKMDESRDFATFVQRSMIEHLTPSHKLLKDLGVKQAPFVVLIGASMPSVLAEISFLTNAQEARLLRTPAYRQKIAEALLDAIRKYQTALKNDAKVVTQQ